MLKQKKYLKMLGLIVFAVFLAACSREPVTESSSGFWNHYIIFNLQQFILWLSQIFFNNYALGIIAFTFVTKIILLPLSHYQMKSMRKTAELQPQIKKIREQYGNDRESQREMQMAIMDFNKENGINQWAGCLPLIIQMPIMIALIETISRTPILHEGTFFWTPLGVRDPYYLLPLIAAFFTWLNAYLILQGQTKDMQQGKVMQLYVLPAMIFFFGMSTIAALALYWAAGNVFSVFQTLLLQNPFKIRAEREEKERVEREKKKALRKAIKHQKRK